MKYILVIILFFIAFEGQTQEAQVHKKRMNIRRHFKNLSVQQINDLKNGVLIVRLYTKNSTISALRKNGNNKQAHEIERKQFETNQEIVNAFRQGFDFCPLYFFYSDYSANVIEQQFGRFPFLNDSLVPDSTIILKTRNFLTADFGTIDQDTSMRFDGYYYDYGEHGLEKRSKYYGGSNMGFGALVLRSDKLVQLHKPFPYYVRTYKSLPFSANSKNVVKKMNHKLERFYKRKQRKTIG